MHTITYYHPADGTLTEYRRRLDRLPFFVLEHRQLRPDGAPHDGRWYPVDDWHLTQLQHLSTGVVEALSEANA